MTPRELKERTKEFATAVIRLVEGFPRAKAAETIGGQLLRAGTSVAANYRSACRARSRREFIARMGVVEEEADETAFWLDLSSDCRLADADRVAALRREAQELLAIAVASIRTARGARFSNPQSAFRNPQCS
jgi:four helix bundle protein